MINIKDFISDLKQYILTSFEQNANFSNIKVAMAYDSENTIKTPQVSISINNNREDDSSNSYDSENISILRVVLYCYNKAMIFDNDTEKTSAILSTTILTNEIQNIFDKNLFGVENNNIIASTRKSYVQPQSIREDGLVYVGILTYEFRVLNDYTKIYNN